MRRARGRFPLRYTRPRQPYRPAGEMNVEHREAGEAFPNEQPQYPALAEAVEVAWSATRHLSREMRREWFAGAQLPDPNDARACRLAGQRNVLTELMRRAVDAAIDSFLRRFRGPESTRSGFSDPENAGVVQETGFMGYRIGYGRGQQLAGGMPTNPALTEAQQRRLSREAFDRLTEGSRLRFETRLGEIKQAMLDGFAEGTGSVEIARRLGQDLDGYERGRLRTIVRTEMGISAMEAQVDVYRERGIERVEVIGDPGTDSLCTDHIGNVYRITETEQLPIYHPNCYCDIVPAAEENG